MTGTPDLKAISADSHITEPPNCYVDFIERRYKDTAPRMVPDPRAGETGEVFVVEGFAEPLALGLVAAAGKDPKTLKIGGSHFSDLHRGGWDPKARLADQDRDGILAEMIYPTIGMTLCSHPDADYKQACMWAYNRWLAEYVGGAPERLYGLGMTAVRSVAEAIADLTMFKEMGFKGVMLPGSPATEVDYDHPAFDPLWRASIELGLPVSFHILTGNRGSNVLAEGVNLHRGPRIGAWQGVIRGCQDIISMFIFGRVFERHPELKLVCVEADAGWVPHFMYRSDHVYKRHRAWLKCEEMKKLPSEYFRDNVYVTFQDDWVAFRMTGMCNPKRLMWANDFPHSDSTWPWSQELLREHTKSLTPEETGWILRDNVRELYKLH